MAVHEPPGHCRRCSCVVMCCGVLCCGSHPCVLPERLLSWYQKFLTAALVRPGSMRAITAAGQIQAHTHQ